MAKHLIEDIKVGISGSEMRDSLFNRSSGSVVTEITLRDTGDNSVMYYGIIELEGIERYLISRESFYEAQMIDDTEPWNKMYEGEPLEFDRDGSIWELLYSFVRADWETVEEMKREYIGTFIEDVEFPEYDEDE